MHFRLFPELSMVLFRNEIIPECEVIMKGSVASTVREKVCASADQYWAVRDFNMESHAVATELSRLRHAGELEWVRRGMYWRGRRTRFGVAGAPAVEAVRKLVSGEEALGAAGWYATNLFRLSTQVSPVPMVAVTCRVPTGLKDVRVVDRSNRWARRSARLNETEVTYLEALEAWDENVELSNSEALSRFVELLDLEAVRKEKLVEASVTESSRVRERLRAVLAESGAQDLSMRVQGAKSPSSLERARRVLPSGVA